MKTPAPRFAFALALPLLALAVPGPASASAVPFSAVPAGKLPAAPDASAPADHIPASEHVDGFFPALQPIDQKRIDEHGGNRYTYVFPTEAQAKAYAANGASDDDETSEGRTCFATGSSRSFHMSFWTYLPPLPTKPKAGSPAALAAAKAAASKKKQPAVAAPPAPSKPILRPLRSERFVPGTDGTGTLEVVDAWLDMDTLGVRVAGKQSVPFKRVAAGPSGLEVFAARDDKQINFFVTPPKVPQQEGTTPATLLMMANRLIAQLPSGSTSSSSSECGYMRITLQAEPGTGQMASVLANAFLPPNPEETADNPGGDSGNEQEEEQRIAGRAIRAVRTRPVVANLSVSQLAKEEDPLVSISFAWAGHDQSQRF